MGSVFRPRVAIVGAGLTGLLTAQGLMKNGFDVVVFEREAHMQARTRDWTLVVHWAMPIMRELMPEALFAQLPEAVCNPYLNFDDSTDSLRLYDGLTGEHMFTSVLPGARRYSRQRLRRLMATGVDIRWGRRLQAIEPAGSTDSDGPVVLRFEEGAPVEVDYVLGADCSGSRVRELVLRNSADATAAAAKRSGIMFATGIVRYNDAARVRSVTDAHPVFSMAMGGGVVGGSGIMYVDEAPDDPARWTVFWNKLWKRSRVGDGADDPTKPSPFAGLQGRAALDYVCEHTPPLCQPFQSHVEWTVEVDNENRARAKTAAKTPADGSGSGLDGAKANTHPDVICYIDDMKYWAPVTFDNFGSHVTLAGDAAHPMLIYRGQGFQHAIVDSRNYVDALIRVREAGGTADAHRREMDQYDAEMVPRGAEAVKQSLQEGENSFDIDKVRNMRMAKQGHGRSA